MFVKAGYKWALNGTKEIKLIVRIQFQFKYYHVRVYFFFFFFCSSWLVTIAEHFQMTHEIRPRQKINSSVVVHLCEYLVKDLYEQIKRYWSIYQCFILVRLFIKSILSIQSWEKYYNCSFNTLIFFLIA